MLIIGLTGGIGSGKTTVAKLFAEKGITVIDTDQIAYEVTKLRQPALATIAAKFGTDILLPDGNLNRALLREKIFANADDRIWLEKLLHPLIRDKVKEQLQISTSAYSIVVIPLLFETESNPLINRILVVDASEQEQVERALARDHLSSPETITAILKVQVPREKRLAGADDVIQNNGTLDELVEKVDKLHAFYLKKCSIS